MDYEEKTVLFSDVREGDLIQTPNGDWTEISQLYDVHTPDVMFLIATNNGEVKVSGTHLFYTVTETDVATFRTYKKKAKKLLSQLTQKTLHEIEDIATADTEKEYHISFVDLISVLGAKTVPGCEEICERVLESVGPVVEESYPDGTVVPIYNAQSVFKQILALAGDKRWEIKKGKVRTALEISFLDENVYI